VRAGDFMRHCLILATGLLWLIGGWPLAGHAQTDSGSQPVAAAAANERSALTRPSSGTGHPAAPMPSAWTQAEIDAARARCRTLLSGLDAVVIAADSIRAGECGAPSPVQLVSVGRTPQVSLSPPPIITCELVAALANWVGAEVQPAARTLLGGPVVRLEVMSAYSCRNAYARAKTKLSEHGHANALDISHFVTERSELAAVLTDWGPTDREMRRLIAAAQAAHQTAAKLQVAGRPPATGRIAETIKPLTAADTLRGSTALAETTFRGAAVLGLAPASPGAALALAEPTKLGGPSGRSGGPVAARQQFLRRVHTGACRYFATVLGPEANDAHRNHFHVDMAERHGKTFCE
jgi:hypothetical protein